MSAAQAGDLPLPTDCSQRRLSQRTPALPWIFTSADAGVTATASFAHDDRRSRQLPSQPAASTDHELALLTRAPTSGVGNRPGRRFGR
jgi:hypothetical protein